MLKALARIMDSALRERHEDPEARAHDLQIATALLLVEVARADYRLELTERSAMLALLRRHFELRDDEVEVLLSRAERTADDHVSLQGFTRQLSEELSVEERHQVVEMLWRVAYADNELDKYEDSLVRKIADLLYVSHSDLIRLRNKVTGL